MNWLLKIVEGPQRGAEIALVGGRRTSFGSDDACDLVVVDSSVPAKAFELDVSDAAVTLLVPGEEAKVLPPFEVRQFGATAIAVGPADRPWDALVYPKAEPETPAPPPEATPAEPQTPTEGAGTDTASEAVATSHRGRGCLVAAFAAALLLLLVIVLLWFFWTPFAQACPWAERARARAVAVFSGKPPADPTSATGASDETASLAQLAKQYALELVETNGVRKLAGNLARRTERQAIRALALAAEPTVQFDLTDDETLLASANELLFVVTEGALKAASASNRVVELTGYVANAAKLEQALRALSLDVPGVARCETGNVQVGGTPPAKVDPTDPTRTVVAAVEPPRIEAKPVPRKELPIAGILLKPYPSVVMRGGLRLAEGAQIGTAVIVRIEADKLVLREGTQEFEWKP